MKILIIGGTFCPPHLAHIAIVDKVQKQFHFDEVFFIPCKTPVLDKQAEASIQHRLAMLTLALQPYPDYKIDLCEINRNTPSYMLDTLKTFRERYGKEASITLLIGMDNFIQLPRWHHYEAILNYGHLLVVDRAGIDPTLSTVLLTLLQKNQSTEIFNIANKPCGVIQRYNAGQYQISSTQIRTTIQEAIQKGLNTDHLITPTVRAYIDKHQLFDTGRGAP